MRVNDEQNRYLFRIEIYFLLNGIRITGQRAISIETVRYDRFLYFSHIPVSPDGSMAL